MKKLRDYGLLKRIIKYWKQLLIFMIVGGVIGGGYSLASGRAYITTGRSSDTVSVAKSALTDEQIENVEITFKTYKSLLRERNETQNDLNFLNSLESKNGKVKSTKLVYRVSASDSAAAYASSWKQLLLNDDLYQTIYEKTNKEISKKHIAQMIQLRTQTELNENQNILSSNEDTQMLLIEVYAKDFNTAHSISDVIKEKATSLSNSLHTNNSALDVTLTGQTDDSVNVSEYNIVKDNYASKINDIIQNINSLSSSLTNDEKTYFEALKSQTDGSDKKPTRSLSKKQLAKYIIVFAIFLGFVYLAYVIIKYYAEDKLHSSTEFTNYYGINVICSGSLNNEQDKKVILEELGYLIKKTGQKIGLLTSVDQLTDELRTIADQNTNFVLLNEKPEEEKDFDQLASVNDVVIFEKINESKIGEIERMLRYYRLKNINILGAVILK